MKTKVLPIKDINFDDDLYPRHSTDWVNIYRYSQSMKVKGVKFPPLTVAETGTVQKKYILVDGLHRLRAMQRNKEKYAECEILKGLSKKQIYIEAVRRNTAHGASLSGRDVAKVIHKLRELKLDLGEISKLVMMPESKIEEFKEKRLTFTPTGKPVALKRPMVALSQETVPEDFEEIQRPIRSIDQNEILNSAIAFLESDALVLNKNTVMLLAKLRDLINEVLKTK